MAKEAGRDPSAMVMVIHAGLGITDKPLGKDRPIFSGSLEQISDDVKACAKIGADEVFFDPAFAPRRAIARPLAVAAGPTKRNDECELNALADLDVAPRGNAQRSDAQNGCIILKHIRAILRILRP